MKENWICYSNQYHVKVWLHGNPFCTTLPTLPIILVKNKPEIIYAEEVEGAVLEDLPASAYTTFRLLGSMSTPPPSGKFVHARGTPSKWYSFAWNYRMTTEVTLWRVRHQHYSRNYSQRLLSTFEKGEISVAENACESWWQLLDLTSAEFMHDAVIVMYESA